MLQLMCKCYLYKYPPLSIARYTFIQLSKLEQCRANKLAQGFNKAAQDSNPGSLSRASETVPLGHCALPPINPTETPHWPLTLKGLLGTATPPYDTITVCLMFFFGMYRQLYVPSLLSFVITSTALQSASSAATWT